ncbi:MAG: hypothetical protein AAGD14_03570 [Planctomycetota bacterium]
MSEFVSRRLAASIASDPPDWETAAKLVEVYGEDDVELFVAVDDRDLVALRTIVDAWEAGSRSLPVHDRNLLKRALKAYRKRLKLARLDAESTVGGGPMSAGRESAIVGVRAPDQFPDEVWDRLVEQGRLIAGRDGLYELPPE